MHDVLRHGACLGLGCAAMGTGDGAAFSSMRDVLFSEAAVASEGAALGIGLLLTGRGASWTCDVVSDEAGSAAAEMLAQAKDTAHEKTIRGIGVALALLCFGQEGAADGLVGQLCGDKDAVLRYGGMFALALAHAGTGSNAAVRRLLHVAVTDVSDDVRRAAVLGLGFVLCRAGREVPQLVAQLAESYNPHVRYGAALAVGIAAAGSGMADAVALLEPLVTDSVDFVRQGALLGLALVLQQESAQNLPKGAARGAEARGGAAPAPPRRLPAALTPPPPSFPRPAASLVSPPPRLRSQSPRCARRLPSSSPTSTRR
jgi:26S proteasome regulatory subunit N2